MKWTDIQLSEDYRYFLFEGKQLFNRHFKSALKFHSPGLAAVEEENGWLHIDIYGNELYTHRYSRTFGFYFDRAAVADKPGWYHINTTGERAYKTVYTWCGNFQENICTVRDARHYYFHINENGEKIYAENYMYAGDFKEGIACVRLSGGLYKHIDMQGRFLNDQSFTDLGVFHKGIATARDQKGWFHCNREGEALYQERYRCVEVFYNGFALVEDFNGQKLIIGESGEKILIL